MWRGQWFDWFGLRKDGAHRRKPNSRPLHHSLEGPLWKGFGHGICNDSFKLNSKVHLFTGFESLVIQCICWEEVNKDMPNHTEVSWLKKGVVKIL